MKELKYLNKYFVKYKYRFLAGIFITIIAQFFFIYTPILVSDSIYTIQKEGLDKAFIEQSLYENVLLVILTALIGGFFTFLMRQTLIVMSRHVEFDLKNEIYQKYQELSQSFYKANRTGDLMNRISEDVAKVRMYVGPAVMYAINTAIRFIVVLIQMLLISPKLTFYTLLPLPILSIVIFKLSNQINKKSSIYQQNLSKLSSSTQESFSGVRVIKAYGLESIITDDFKQLSDQSKIKNLDLSRLNAMFGPLMIFLIGASNLLVILIGGLMYVNGELPHIGIIAEFILYVNMLTWPVASLGWISAMVQEAEASQKRINEFMEVQPDIVNQSDNTNDLTGNIVFDNVSFTYDDTKIQALKNVSFSVNKGEVIAVLGNTGSGKSTLLALLSRLYDVSYGDIQFDGVSIKEIELQHLRKSIAVVPQDSFLFSDTIKNNIKFGNVEASDSEVEEVAKRAVVHQNIIDFKDGYETVLGERGVTLSGGQKQRVSIARALIKNAPILLLDDSLSAVDTETEEAILHNLLNSDKKQTIFIVSHRISSAKNADKIIVLNEGEIIQIGTHNQLINQAGYYKDLYLMQAQD